MPALVEYRPDGSARQSWSLEKDATIVVGRNPDQATIVIPHVSVSRKHAVLKLLSSRRWRVADLGAVNGTYVDDVLIRTDVEGEVDGGEIFRFGENGYEYKIETVPPTTSKSGSDDEGSKRSHHAAGCSGRKHRQANRNDELSISSGSASPNRSYNGRRGAMKDRVSGQGRVRARERESSRDRDAMRMNSSRVDSEEKYRDRDRDRRREKERKRGRSQSRSRSRSRDWKSRRRSKWDEAKPKSLFSDQPSPEELEKQKALLLQLAAMHHQRRRPICNTVTPSCILEPPPGVTPQEDSKPKLSVQEKRKLLWGKKDGKASSADAEVPAVSAMQTPHAGPPSGQTQSADPNNYAKSFRSDKEKQNKFLKLLGYKGGLTTQDDDVDDLTDSKNLSPDEDEIKRRESVLESQYLCSVLRSDGRKAGLGL